MRQFLDPVLSPVKFDIIGRALYCAARHVSNYIAVCALSRYEEVNYKCDLEGLIRTSNLSLQTRPRSRRSSVCASDVKSQFISLEIDSSSKLNSRRGTKSVTLRNKNCSI